MQVKQDSKGSQRVRGAKAQTAYRNPEGKQDQEGRQCNALRTWENSLINKKQKTKQGRQLGEPKQEDQEGRLYK